uniref:SLC12 domain-containing protein n=1 Tax=Onchocerca volvulus TaxID=6282 RepID=A0A8R1XNG7_ONCVO
MDLWWVVEGDDLLLSFIYIICRNYRWTFTKLRIFAVIKMTEFETVKDQVSKRIQQASLEVNNVEFRPVIPDDIAAYESAKLSISNQNIQPEEGPKDRRIYKNESPLRLNNLIRKESINADLIIFNLPRPRGDMPTSRLLQILDAVTEQLTRVVVFRPPTDF